MSKYPKIKVKLTGEDGNAFAIIGRVSAALRAYLQRQGVETSEVEDEIKLFQKEATSGNYQDLLCTCADWVSVS